MVFTEVVRGGNGADTLDRSDSVSARYRGMGSVEIRRLNLSIANVLLARKPVFACKEGRVGIGKGASG